MKVQKNVKEILEGKDIRESVLPLVEEDISDEEYEKNEKEWEEIGKSEREGYEEAERMEQPLNQILTDFDSEDHEAIKNSFETEDSGDQGTFKTDEGEYRWFKDYDTAERIAVNRVREDLDDQPEMFNQDWLMNHINEDRYWDDVESDINNWVYESPESYTGFIDNEAPEMDEDDDESYEGYSEDQVERMFQGYFADLKQQGVLEWLKELGYDGEELSKQITPYLDTNEAAQDAVDMDGVGHFLAYYDGDLYEPQGHDVVYVREN